MIDQVCCCRCCCCCCCCSGTLWCVRWPLSSTFPGPSPRRRRTSPSSPPHLAPCESLAAGGGGQSSLPVFVVGRRKSGSVCHNQNNSMEINMLVTPIAAPFIVDIVVFFISDAKVQWKTWEFKRAFDYVLRALAENIHYCVIPFVRSINGKVGSFEIGRGCPYCPRCLMQSCIYDYTL